MLKSTHQPAPRAAEAPLPPGWSEHAAPSGHSYYYNGETKQSTYTRPVYHIPPPVQAPVIPHNLVPSYGAPPPTYLPFEPQHSTGANRAPVADFRNYRQPRPQPADRPKTKHALPNCAPWLLIKTRLGRRFVHNPETKESFWKYPKDVIEGVVEFDTQERKRKEREERGEVEEEPVPQRDILGLPSEPVSASVGESNTAAPHIVPVVAPTKQKDYDSDEYEEVEVTDDEEEGGEDTSGAPKRRKADYEAHDSDAEAAAAAAQEFTEADMEAQLAAMGATYDLAPDEYGGENAEDWDEEGYDGEEEALGLTADEAAISFGDMLTEHGIDPYKPWDAIIESADASILLDSRYTVLPTMKARRQAFSEWSALRIAAQRRARENALKADPRVAYLALLSQCASAKLYWPEFKRKFKKEPAMKDIKLADREREKLYREHITRITKMSEGQLERDLEALLESVSSSETWNRSTGVEELPEAITTDVRYISLKPDARDALVRSYIRKLPRASDVDGQNNPEDAAARVAGQKREQALHERQRAVEESKRRQQKEIQYGRSRLEEEEQNLNRAMKVGKTGLRGALTNGIAPPEGPEETVHDQ